jgi:hypothetical protein
MSKPSRRPQREEIKAQRCQKKHQEKALRDRHREAGLVPRPVPALPNTCSADATIAQEQEAREQAVTGQLRILRRELPHLLKRLGRIPDPRNPRKCRHKLTVLLLCGLLMFVFQFASPREVNREMTRPQFEANLRLLFPELKTLPHADTLYRLLRDMDVAQIEQAHVALIRRLIRAKKFRRYLINNCYPIAVDGSQKLARDVLWDENLLQRTHGKDEKRHTQYFVYVLEASLAFRNGMVIPLLSEFLVFQPRRRAADPPNTFDRTLRYHHAAAVRRTLVARGRTRAVMLQRWPVLDSIDEEPVRHYTARSPRLRSSAG